MVALSRGAALVGVDARVVEVEVEFALVEGALERVLEG